MDRKFAILVVGYDGYKILWDPFFELLRKNWPNCPYKIYLVTNSLRPRIENVNIITTSKEYEWSKKVSCALKKINEEYVLMLLEDFFITFPVDEFQINDIIDELYMYQLKYVKFPYQERKNKRKSIPPNSAKYKESNIMYTIKKNEKYGISLMPGIWEKQFLIDLIGNGNYNPWKFEIDRVREAKNEKNGYFDDCAVVFSNPFNIFNGVIQGRYVPSTYKYILKQGVNLDEGRIKKMSYIERIKLLFKRFFIQYTPEKLVPFAKNVGRRIGFKFVSDDNA